MLGKLFGAKKKEPEKKEVLEWAQGDLLKHITEGIGRSLLEAFTRERVSRLRLYTYELFKITPFY